MEEKNLLDLVLGQNQIQKVMEMNQQTERFGLALTQEDAKVLVESRKNELQKQQRVEFGEGTMPLSGYSGTKGILHRGSALGLYPRTGSATL